MPPPYSSLVPNMSEDLHNAHQCPRAGLPVDTASCDFSTSRLSASLLDLVSRLEVVREWSDHDVDRSHWLSPSLPPLDAPSGVTGFRLRAAVWNLNCFNVKKATHPGYLEAACLVLLRANIQLVGLLEVIDLRAVELIRDELNSPTLPNVRRWMAVSVSNASQPPAAWRVAYPPNGQSTGRGFRSSEHAVFLYNSSQLQLLLSMPELLEPKGKDSLFARNPCLSECQIGNTKFVFVLIHIKAAGLRNSQCVRTQDEIKALGILVEAFYLTNPKTTGLILMGDFNLNPSHEAFSSLYAFNLWPLLNHTQPTTISAAEEPNSFRRADRAYDNVWFSPNFQRASKPNIIESFPLLGYADSYGILTQGIRHPFIPKESGAGSYGAVSDHCPVWFDLILTN